MDHPEAPCGLYSVGCMSRPCHALRRSTELRDAAAMLDAAGGSDPLAASIMALALRESAHNPEAFRA